MSKNVLTTSSSDNELPLSNKTEISIETVDEEEPNKEELSEEERKPSDVSSSEEESEDEHGDTQCQKHRRADDYDDYNYNITAEAQECERKRLEQTN